MKKTYIYSSLTRDNSSFLKRFSHKKRFQKAINLLDLPNKASILDFGTGDGYFLTLLNSKVTAKLTGYEPIDDMFEQLKETLIDENIELVKSLDGLEKKFDIIYCLEVLEHFDKKNQQLLLKKMKSNLNKSGKIIISVPIEVGLASLVKNLIRVSIKQFERDTNKKNIVKAFKFEEVDRDTKDGYIYSHIGFNYKKLEEVFKDEKLTITKKVFSPFTYLRNLNTQVFYVLTE